MINAMRLNKYRLHLYDFRACLSFPFNERDLKVLSFLIDRILLCEKELFSVSSFYFSFRLHLRVLVFISMLFLEIVASRRCSLQGRGGKRDPATGKPGLSH